MPTQNNRKTYWSKGTPLKTQYENLVFSVICGEEKEW
jgi:hypothetical protein